MSACLYCLSSLSLVPGEIIDHLAMSEQCLVSWDACTSVHMATAQWSVRDTHETHDRPKARHADNQAQLCVLYSVCIRQKTINVYSVQVNLSRPIAQCLSTQVT
jgi:hypothetical protein